MWSTLPLFTHHTVAAIIRTFNVTQRQIPRTEQIRCTWQRKNHKFIKHKISVLKRRMFMAITAQNKKLKSRWKKAKYSVLNIHLQMLFNRHFLDGQLPRFLMTTTVNVSCQHNYHSLSCNYFPIEFCLCILILRYSWPAKYCFVRNVLGSLW